jgi:hypothetical protein
VTKSNLSELADYIEACIYDNYLMGILITSAAEGKLASDGFDYGPGKSTLLLQIAYHYLRDWDKVFEVLHYFPWELEEFFFTARRRILGVPVFFLMDDMQLTLGKERSRDPYVRSLKSRLSTSRPQLAVFMGTAPDIGQLAKPFRYFFNFQMIVPCRGVYEVQRLKKWADFKNPYETRASLDYSGETLELGFDALEKDVQARYDEWRDEMNKRNDRGEGDIRLKSIRNILTEQSRELLSHVIEKGGLHRTTIITNLDQRREMKLLKACGLIEQFQDMILPTRNAKRIMEILQ